MNLGSVAGKQLQSVRAQFRLSTGVLSESVADYCPTTGMMTVAQHVAHAAQVIDWLMEGAFRPEGFDLDFEPQIARVMATTSLESARKWFETSIGRAIDVIGNSSNEELLAPLPEGPVMGGLPKLSIVSAIAEHTSHHRGALAVYARLKNLAPESPYGM